ncbi:queuosine precursor transporter [Aliifodinibius sp. S!AR15-10]|uniref:queuosine precursor transporter n=1 Tax=Aliifodinibius sp. S!AR15-10 TaxID=2950437 RepID=UPI002859C81A|nr:queuosine precursor transporter [Aliifodinibius sp. S!AR15-10]MDR8391659.1 queuosine precursor transporter [Aliifodinibius sp. S!AR15-10]
MKLFTERTPFKRDVLFLSLSGIFLTSLVLGNVIGTTKFVTIFSVELPGWLQSITPSLVRDENIYTMSVPVGVIAYPFTFLATDLISELFGRKKAQMVVWVGFAMNVFMLFLMSVNHWLPNTDGVSGGINLFEGVYEFMVGNTIASIIAYLTAQTVDVRLFHFWKRLTKGKHLWLRNNASTTVSQLVDSTAILSILYIAGNLGDNVNSIGALIILILNSYLFKFFFALFDTPLFYIGVKLFREYDEDPSEFSLLDEKTGATQS